MRIKLLVAIAALSAACLPSHAGSLSIVTNVPVSWGPAAFAIDPVTSRVFVGSVTDDAGAGVTSQIQILAGAAVVGTIKRAGLNPVGLGIDAVGRKLYAASFASNKVFVYDLATNAVAGEIAVPSGGPWGLDVDRQSGRAFVAEFSSNKLALIDRAWTTTTTDLAPAGCTGPVGVAVNTAHSTVFVSCLYSGVVVVVSSVTGAVLSTIDVGGLGAYPWGIASEFNGDNVYLAEWRGGAPDAGTVVVMSAASNAITATAYTGGGPIGVAVSPLGGTPYVTLSATNEVAALTPGSAALAEKLALPTDPKDGKNEPHAAIVSPTGRLVYVGNFHAESVSVVAAPTYA